MFDNFLILAHDFDDAATKLERVIQRCAADFGVVLKMQKSHIGVQKVEFFGYEVFDGKWQLSQSCKDAIAAFPFPSNKKEMQSFLGCSRQGTIKSISLAHVKDGVEWVSGSARDYVMESSM